MHVIAKTDKKADNTFLYVQLLQEVSKQLLYD